MASRSPGVHVLGLDELRRDLRAVDRGATKAVNAGLRGAMVPVAARAATLAPRRSGKLARSLRPFATARGAGVRSRLPYAAPIQWGWPKHHIKPSLFITRAVEGQESEIVDAVGDALEHLAGRHGFK